MKLLPSRRTFHIHHTTMHQFTVSPRSKSHARIIKYGVCVFNCNLPSAVWAEWPGSFTCYYGNAGWYRCRKRAWKADPGEENSPTAPAGLEPPLTSWSSVQRSNHSTIPAIYYVHDTGKYQCHINIYINIYNIKLHIPPTNCHCLDAQQEPYKKAYPLVLLVFMTNVVEFSGDPPKNNKVRKMDCTEYKQQQKMT